MIKLKDVSKYYNSNGVVTVALQHINLEFNKNEIVAITGESGSGKSTLLNIITGVDNYDEGEIYYFGNETSYFNNDDMDNFRKKHVGFIFQNYNIIDSYTVLQNVMLPLLINGLTKKEAKAKALALIAKVGLAKRVHNRGSKLSGGEKQRVIIARALASDCEILACDEPTGNLDSKTSKEIIELIREVAKDKLVLIVTHNYAEIKDIATRKVVLSDGKVIENTVIEAKPNDKEEKLNLESLPVKNKTIGLLAWFNILSTPRKSFLIALIFLVVTFILYTLPQQIYYENKKSYNTYSYSKYPIDQDNYLIAYSKNGIEKAKLNNIQGDIKLNPYVELTPFRLENSYADEVYYAPYDFSYSLEFGKEPTGSDEILLICPENKYMSSADLVEATLKNFKNVAKPVRITGIAKSEHAKTTLFKSGGNLDEFLMDGLIESLLTARVNNKGIEIEFTSEVETINLKYNKAYAEAEVNLELTLRDTYSLALPYEKTPALTEEFSLQINPDFISEASFPINEVRILADNVEAAKKELAHFDISYIHPAQEVERDLYTRLMLAINLILLILPVIIVYLMSYVILSKIYLSKNTEYSIMRILGVRRKDMFKMIAIETMSIGLAIALFTYLLTMILGFTIDYRFFKIYKDVNALVSILYFIVMVIFSYLLARKFNRKLFSDTSRKVLKEE